MKTLLTFSFLLITTLIYSQYNYGLEVEQQDAKIEGKLALGNYSDSNLFIGIDAGINSSTGIGNTSIGFKSGMSNSVRNFNTTFGAEAGRYNEGFINTLIGGLSGKNITTGWGNTLLGYSSGTVLKQGSANVMIGRGAGFTNVFGSSNVFIGDSAGHFETGSNKLYIESSQPNQPDNQTPLIYGEFDNDKAGINWDSSIPLPATLSVNGTLHISETTKLEPQTAEPSTCTTAAEHGLMYYDSSVTPNKLKLCTDAGWEDLN